MTASLKKRSILKHALKHFNHDAACFHSLKIILLRIANALEHTTFDFFSLQLYKYLQF